MNQLNSPQMAPEAILATLEERQNRVIEEDRSFVIFGSLEVIDQ